MPNRPRSSVVDVIAEWAACGLVARRSGPSGETGESVEQAAAKTPARASVTAAHVGASSVQRVVQRVVGNRLTMMVNGQTVIDDIVQEGLPSKGRVALVPAGRRVEFANIFHGLGVATTLVYRGREILGRFDHDLRWGVPAGVAINQLTDSDDDVETVNAMPRFSDLPVNGLLTLVISGESFGKASYAGTIDVTSAVPEPTTYGMLLGGLGVMGFLARRRKA